MNPNESIPEEMLSAYIDGELNADDRQSVERALEQDAEMRALLSDLELVRKEIQSLPRHSLSKEFATRVANAAEIANSDGSPTIDATQPTPSVRATPSVQQSRSRRRVVGGLIAAAAAVLLALFAIPPLAKLNGPIEVADLHDDKIAETDNETAAISSLGSLTQSADDAIAPLVGANQVERFDMASDTVTLEVQPTAESTDVNSPRSYSFDGLDKARSRSLNLATDLATDLDRDPSLDSAQSGGMGGLGFGGPTDDEPNLVFGDDLAELAAAPTLEEADTSVVTESLGRVPPSQLGLAQAKAPSRFDAVLYFAAYPGSKLNQSMKSSLRSFGETTSLSKDLKRIEETAPELLALQLNSHDTGAANTSKAASQTATPRTDVTIPPDAKLFVLEGTVQHVRTTLQAIQLSPSKIESLDSNVTQSMLGYPTLSAVAQRQGSTAVNARARAAMSPSSATAVAPTAQSNQTTRATRSQTPPSFNIQPPIPAAEASSLLKRAATTENRSLRLLLVVPAE